LLSPNFFALLLKTSDIAVSQVIGHNNVPSSGGAGKYLMIFIVRLSKNFGKVNFWFFCNKIGEYWLLFGYFVMPVYFGLHLFLVYRTKD